MGDFFRCNFQHRTTSLRIAAALQESLFIGWIVDGFRAAALIEGKKLHRG